MTSRWLYLPIDVKVREFEAKAFLAVKAALRGYKVVIGQKQKVQAVTTCYPRGTFVGFSGVQNLAKEYKNLRNRGFNLVLMDEEGLVTHHEETYVRNRLTSDALSQADIFVAWGENQKQRILKHRPMLKDKIFSIGNPRFDVIRPEFSALYKEAVSDIKKKHGKIILINSNFGSCNHFSGANNYFNLLIERKVINTPEDHKYFQTYFSYRKRVMKEIQNALPVLSNSFPDHTIILRPHPSESHQAWQDTAKDLKNVKVLHEGSVIPWMKAADAVIHNFCTTSTEYIAMGGTPIAYRPVIDEALESTLPTVVSIVAHTPEELINAIQDRISNETNPTADTKRLFLASHIANISDIFSVDLLLDQIEKLQNRKTSLLRFVFYGFCYKIKKFLRKIKNLFKKQNNYTTHKFPHITKNELRSMIRHFAEINGNSTPLNIKEIDLNTFLISIK